MRLNFLHLCAAAACISLAAQPLVAQSTPLVDQGYAGSTMVSGEVTPGAHSVVVYDVTTSSRTTLGTSQSIDKTGNFAVLVASPLVLGHSVVVVDSAGAISAPMVVSAPPASASHR